MDQSSHRSITCSTMNHQWKPERIVWVGDDGGLQAAGDTILQGSAVPVGVQDINNNPLIPPCYQPIEIKRIDQEAGERWTFNKRGSAHKEIHQSLVVLSEMSRIIGCATTRTDYFDLKKADAMAELDSRNIAYRKKDKVQQLRNMLIADDDDQSEAGLMHAPEYWAWDKLVTTLETTPEAIADHTLFIFCWTGLPNVPTVHAVYEKLASMEDQYGTRVRCYPDFGDLHESEFKLGDIAALDTIARSEEIEAYRYWPQTCYRSRTCALDPPFVIKRTHSSCGADVDLDPNADAESTLRCRSRSTHGMTTRSSPSPTPDARDDAMMKRLKVTYINFVKVAEPVTFHQKKVDSLIQFGEFKIIIATVPDEDGLRGAKGVVFEAFHTKPQAGNSTEPLVNVMSRVPSQLLGAEHCGSKTYQDLETFALHVFERLRSFRGGDIPEPRPSRSPGISSPLTRRRDSDTPESGRPSQRPRLSSPAGDETTQAVPDDETFQGFSSPVLTAEHDVESAPIQSTEAPQQASADDTVPIVAQESPQRDDSPAGGSLFTDMQDPYYRSTMFQSLEVGVRLDIGISSAEDGHRFFVNEITREWYGDLISYRTGEPRTRICSALAKARVRYLFGYNKEEDKSGSAHSSGDDDSDGGNDNTNSGDDGENEIQQNEIQQDTRSFEEANGVPVPGNNSDDDDGLDDLEQIGSDPVDFTTQDEIETGINVR